MGELDDIEAFVRVAELLSFSRAAERLGVTKSVVSRRIDRLERSLGTRLLSRTTRGVGPTEAGREFERRCRDVLAALGEARDAVAGRDGAELVGPLRVAAPLAFGTRHLAPALAAFAAQHPKLVLDVAYADRAADLIADGFDLGVRIAPGLPDSSLVARRLSPVRNALVASPAYLERHGAPRSPGEVVRHPCLVITHSAPGEQWRFRVGRRWLSLNPPRVRLRADSGDALCAAAVAGLGLAALPTFIVGEALGRGELRVLLEEFPLPERGLYLLRPPGQPPAKVRALIDHLAAAFGPEPYWDPCWRKGHAVPVPAAAA